MFLDVRIFSSVFNVIDKFVVIRASKPSRGLFLDPGRAVKANSDRMFEQITISDQSQMICGVNAENLKCAIAFAIYVRIGNVHNRDWIKISV
jgi:hypothetical protein